MAPYTQLTIITFLGKTKFSLQLKTEQLAYFEPESMATGVVTIATYTDYTHLGQYSAAYHGVIY